MAEERRLLQYFERHLGHLCEAVWASNKSERGAPMPKELRATAICFLKRFYLHASMMEYDPRIIVITCIALACKAEDCQLVATLEELLAHPAVVAELGHAKIESALSVVQESELLLLQGTRFHLMLHHPYRPLRGWIDALEKHSGPAMLTQTASQRAVECIHRGVHTDAVFLHSPSRLALAALLAGCDAQGLPLDDFLQSTIGAHPSVLQQGGVEGLKRTLRGISAEFFTEVPAVTIEDLETDALWRRCQTIWGRLVRKKDKKDVPVKKKRPHSSQGNSMPPSGLSSTKKAKMVSFKVGA